MVFNFMMPIAFAITILSASVFSAQNNKLSETTIHQAVLKKSDFSTGTMFLYMPYGESKEEIRRKKITVDQIQDLTDVEILGAKPTILFIVSDKKGIVQNY